MPTCLSRLSLDPGYALDHLADMGSCFGKILEGIPAEFSAERVVTRFSFCLYRLTAETRLECEKALLNAWESFCPGGSRPRIITVTETDGDRGKVIREVLSVYYGAENYQKLCAELYSSVPLLEKNGSLDALIMRNYLFAIDSGNGFSTLLSSFGDFLRKTGVYGDKTDVRTQFAEFRVTDKTEGGATSVDDLIEKFIGDYLDDCNVVGIDVSWFLEGEKLDDLRSFLHRLYRFQKQVVFVFRVPFLEKKALDRISAALDDVALTRTVVVPPLHDSVLAEHMWDRVRNLGVSPDVSVIDPFFAKVAKEKSDGRFYGFKTVSKIVDEMILLKAARDAERQACSEETQDDLLMAGDLPEDYAKVQKSKNGYDELHALIGMEKVEKRVREIVAQVKAAMKNEKLDRPCIHMRFLGHPGTGKTTVARIVGRIFREEGILRKGAFLEYSARSLCAEYVGQTAVRTASICRDAYGSVLFIDEAYALYTNDFETNDYGKEALTTLISEMENHRDDMLVIMAGYTDDMETLMKGNAGLRSRMPYAIEFPNYTKDQLFEIFMMMVKDHFSYTQDLEDEARSFFNSLTDEYVSSKEFANARFVRNLYERTWSKAALRSSLAGADDFTLTREDFVSASAEKEFSEKLAKKMAKIGF